MGLPPAVNAAVLLAAPKVVSAIVAALGDYYTFKLAQHIYGKDSYPAFCALELTTGSAWNWFVSTRSFSNCVETTLTIMALYNWPFHWALGVDEVGFQVDSNALRVRQTDSVTASGSAHDSDIDETTKLRRSLFCATAAVILRPTNAIIWVILVLATFLRGMYHHGVHWEIGALIREGMLCGSVVLTLSALVDRLFYGVWTFPMWHFLKFNVLQSIAVFYGNNNWHYYLSQGYPLLLTFAIIPAVIGLTHTLLMRAEPSNLSIQSRLILHRLALVAVVLPALLSVLSHKEVRFIYPILPALHIIAARPLANLLRFPEVIGKARIRLYGDLEMGPRIGYALFILMNTVVAVFFSNFHNTGLISVTNYIRSEFETQHLNPSQSSVIQGQNLTFAVLMPCHSLPWRSHLQYPATNATSGISGWALTCEPPLDLTAAEKANYRDEADIFYLNPSLWVTQNMVRDIPKGSPAPGVYAPDPIDAKKIWSNPNPSKGVWLNEAEGGQETGFFQSRKRAWPDYLIFFGQLEHTMHRVLRGSAYQECARFYNSLFHDDSRRIGDVIVWCLPEKDRVRTRSVRRGR